MGRSVLPVPPLRRHPAPPCPWRPTPPLEGPVRWTSKTLFRRTVDQTPPLARQAGDRTPRGARPGLPFAPLRRLPDRPRRNWLSPPAPAFGPAPSRGAGLWSAPLSPGGPALMGFRRSSTRLEGASCGPALAYGLFGSPLRAFRLGRGTPSPGRSRPRSPHGLRRGGRRPSLSRARQTFACRGVLRVASFR